MRPQLGGQRDAIDGAAQLHVEQGEVEGFGAVQGQGNAGIGRGADGLVAQVLQGSFKLLGRADKQMKSGRGGSND